MSVHARPPGPNLCARRGRGLGAGRGAGVGALLALALGACAAKHDPRLDPAPDAEVVALGPTEQDEADILELLRELELADTNDDLEAVVALYADDVMWLPPGTEPVVGLPAVCQRYADLFAGFDVTMDLTVASIELEGPSARVRGNTTLQLRARQGDETARMRDRFIMVVRRNPAGEWRIWRLAWTPAAAEAAPAAPASATPTAPAKPPKPGKQGDKQGKPGKPGKPRGGAPPGG